MASAIAAVRLVLDPGGLPLRIVVPDWIARFDAIGRMTTLKIEGMTLSALGERLLAAFCIASLDEDADRITAVVGTSGGMLQECGCATFGRVEVGLNRMAALSLSVRDCGSFAIFRLPTEGSPLERVKRAVLLLAAARYLYPTDAWMEASGFGITLFPAPGESTHWPEAELIRLASPPDSLPPGPVAAPDTRPSAMT